MSVSFLSSDIRWNMRSVPTALPKTMLQAIALPAKLVHKAKSTIYVPVFDSCDEVCLVPDCDDGAITYKQLFEALYEYYDQTMHPIEFPKDLQPYAKDIRRIDGLGIYVEYGGFIAYDLLDGGYRLTLNLFF